MTKEQKLRLEYLKKKYHHILRDKRFIDYAFKSLDNSGDRVIPENYKKRLLTHHPQTVTDYKIICSKIENNEPRLIRG